MVKWIKRLGRIAGWAAITLAGLVALELAVGFLVYPPEYVVRLIAWGDSDSFDWQKFPNHPLAASASPRLLPNDPDPRVAEVFSALAATPDWDAFLEANDTQAFLVVHDGAVVFEGYYNNTRRDSIVTSFSVAKSFTSALVGIAIDEGRIASVNDPITRYLPELLARDSRFSAITVRHLLLMASGLEYQEFRFPGLNSDDPLTTYHPDQRWLALNNTRLLDPPGAYFQYNKYHPQLLGMILERATGMTVTEYLQTRLWDVVGMEFDGSWSTDSRESDFEKMETGVNARAIDFARFGQLFLDGGASDGRPIVSSGWVRESTAPPTSPAAEDYYPAWFSNLPGTGYYGYMWWGLSRSSGGYDFAAEGDRGQYIYISPGSSLVIVRNGIDYGIPHGQWLSYFFEFSDRY